MSTDEVLAALGTMGLSVRLREDGTPALVGPPGLVGPPVLRLLKHHREEIVRRLTPKPVREWLWPTGHRYRERATDGWPDTHHASGAWWWRLEGETTWRPVPGRNPDNMPPPEGKADA